MKKAIQHSFFAFTILFVSLTSFAQSPYTLNQVIVLNQGPYNGSRTTVGSYNPATKSYQRFDSIPEVRFSNYVIIDNGNIYVAADSLLIKYDLSTKQRLAQQTVHGIREIAVWNNQLLVTRGDVSPLTSYFQVYDKNSLDFVYELKSVSAATEGVRVLHDTAYVAVNGFGTGIGKLAVIDLNNQVENREINLGATGANPYNVEVETTNNTIYTVNSLSNYDSTSITKYIPSTGKFTNTVVNQSSACGISAYYLNNIYFQLLGKNNIGVLNTSGLTVWDSLTINKSIIGMAPDSVHGYMYTGSTDYATYGKVVIYNLFGGVIDSFSTGITPGNFAFDVQTAAAVKTVNLNTVNVQVYPSLVHDNLTVVTRSMNNEPVIINITDCLGKTVYSQSGLNTSGALQISLANNLAGVYFVNVKSGNTNYTQKVVKL